MHPVVEQMYTHDAFSQWLGIERLEEKPGYCRLRMQVRPEMTNGFGIAHGGIAYSLADSALAFASNAHGRQAVSIETAIAHTEPVKAGEWITAEAEEENLRYRLGIYKVSVTKEDGTLVALFRGTVYRTGKDWAL